MRIPLASILSILLYLSCTSQVEEQPIEKFVDPTSCKICLIEDNLENIKRELIIQNAINAEKSIIDSLIKVQNEFLAEQTKLSKKYTHENGDLEKVWLDCGIYHDIPKRELTREHVELLKIIYAYRWCIAVHEFDKSEKNKLVQGEDGLFKLNIRGVKFKMTKNQIDDYFNLKEKEYQDVMDYQTEKIKQACNSYSGKQQDIIYKSYLLIIDTYCSQVVEHIDYLSEDIVCEIYENDDEFQKLISKYHELPK